MEELFSSLASSFKSFKSLNFAAEELKELIKSSNNFFSLITFCEFDLSCQKSDWIIFSLILSNFS